MASEYVCSLDEASLKVAKKELGEEPKERMGQIATLRQWVQQQPHLTCDTDSAYLLRYLRVGKFSQLRARTTLENFLQCKVDNADWLYKVDVAEPKIQNFLKSGYILDLKYSPSGQRVTLLRPQCLDTSNKHYNKNDVMRAMIGYFFYMISDERTQVNGIRYLIDFTDIPLNIMTYFGTDDLKRSTKMWEGTFPARFKGFHYYNTGPLFETMMALIKPILSKKMQGRLNVHGSNLEEVYKVFPMSMLPDEYLPDDYKGPSAGPIKKLVETMTATMSSPAVREKILYETGDNFSMDKSKKPNDLPQESFRKLNVD